MAPITFMASTNRETRDRGRHRAEVVRSNIKVTTQTRSTQSCSDAECAVMDFGEVGPIKRPHWKCRCYHLCLLIVLIVVGGFYVRNLCF